ncbi:hypothetical protein AC578_7003 [Pseudocercospora eumusae]|uniref:BTB domain-containing protein n=1 Tax=Pseudocercospora eumusae TaxID=321146 RepID=A0A139HCN0_9PEZI|nr:hypothetical protein AC578_7003 [Pseudocercospora eumusae]
MRLPWLTEESSGLFWPWQRRLCSASILSRAVFATNINHQGPKVTMAIERCFDDDGDVVLDVDTANPHLLRVSSKNLMCASPVFKALLGPHFREGQAKRSAEDPAKVCLPEDNGSGMAMICQQLHPSHEASSTSGAKMDIAAIFDYAVLVDKYQLVSTLHLQSEAILLSWLVKDSHATSDLGCFLKAVAASYLLRNKQAFKIATKFVMNRKSLASELQHAYCWTLLPSSVVGTLQIKSNQSAEFAANALI